MVFKEVEHTIDELPQPQQEIVVKARDHYKFSTGDPKAVLRVVVPIFAGLIMIWFGLTTTGSYYEPASRFGGFLSTIWYSYQAGNLLAIIGGIAIYDAIRKTGYL